ncbi:MAG: type II toxin-antitoxin system VapC family toxin [bacterium]
MSFVLDCSVAIAWCFNDESNSYTDAALEKTGAEGAFVPSIWPLEIQNVLLVAERRSRLGQAQSARFLEILGALPVFVDREHTEWLSRSLMDTARKLKLSAYDATYIELAMRQRVPLATLDKRLRKAAQKAGVQLFKS